MARNLFVLALIFVAVVGVTMAAEAPSSSPKSSPTTASSPKKSTPETASPKSSPAPPTSSDSPAASPSDDEDSIDLAAPAPGPSSEFTEEEPSTVDEESTSGASSLKVSAAVAAVAAGFFAF